MLDILTEARDAAVRKPENYASEWLRVVGEYGIDTGRPDENECERFLCTVAKMVRVISEKCSGEIGLFERISETLELYREAAV